MTAVFILGVNEITSQLRFGAGLDLSRLRDKFWTNDSMVYF